MNDVPINRLQLLDWLWPHCHPERAALLYSKGSKGLSPGWITTAADAQRALKAYRLGQLSQQVFQSVTQKGVPYKIAGAKRLGLVPHRNGQVTIFCVDLDDHTGDGGNVRLLEAVNRFFDASPIVFTSKGGKGLHLFFQLAESIPAEGFVAWAKAWGFNRQGQPEVFPKSAKNSQAWLPNEPNAAGGDTYRRGTFEGCVVRQLPPAPAARLTSTTLTYLRGFVGAPGRNEALNKAAYELGRQRVPEEEAWRLCQRGSQLCGLLAEEPEQTRTTFNSGYNAGLQAQPKGTSAASDTPSIRLRRLDGIGNGERFVDHYGLRVRYCYELKNWLVWTGKYWSLDAQAAVESLAKKTARLILMEMELALEQARSEGKGDEELAAIESAYQVHYKAAARVHGVKDTLTMAQSEPGIKVTVAQMDRDLLALNVANGTVDLRTGQLRPHRPRDGITRLVKVSFNPRARCPLWQKFLLRIFDGNQELIEYLQRAVGYSLTGLVSEQCLFFLFGTGQNGKTIFLQTLLSILSEYSQKAPTQMIMKQERGHHGNATPDMARLRGVRMVVTAELEENQRMGEARVKDLTGADRVVARQLYCAPIEFEPTHKLWIYGNHKPTIKGTDKGIWRRMRLIPFMVTIPEEEQDKQLDDKLQAEAEGILAWAVEGCLAWQRQGLGLPEAVRKATQEYRQQSDHLGQFMDECCVVASEAWTHKSDLYECYEQWAKAAGEQPLGKRKLGARLMERGFSEGRTETQRYWLGLGLLAHETGQSASADTSLTQT